MSDNESLAGTASEFLGLRSDAGAPPSDDTDLDTENAQDADVSATATDDDAPDEDLENLSAADRVAAVFGQEPAESTEAIAEPGEREEGERPNLDDYTPEQLREMAEEFLKLKDEVSAKDVDAEQRLLEAEVARLDADATESVRQYFEQRYEAQVISRSDAHYGQLLTSAEAQLFVAAQEKDDPLAYFQANVERMRRPILKAQRTWEDQQATAWRPQLDEAVNAAVAQARKQNPALRKRFAEYLCDNTPDGTERTHPLPKRAVEELLKITNTDDMPTVAQSLEDAIKARNSEKRQEKQARASDAAKTAARNGITTPPTGKPRSQKPAALKGDEEEWLEMMSKSRSAFARA